MSARGNRARRAPEAVRSPGANASPAAWRGVFLVVSMALLLLVAIKAVTWGFPHDEPDELVYWHLAGHWAETGDYSLRGTAVLPTLPARTYDRPLFHHPWLFATLLVPFAKAGAVRAAILVPWLGHALAVVAVALLGVAITRERREIEASHPAFFLPVIAVTLDPELLLLSRRLWPDALLAGLGALAVALVALAVRSARPRVLLIAAGFAAGLATLVKLPGVLVLPVVALLACAGREGRERGKALALSFAPWALLVLPWFVTFARRYGRLTPSWLAPDAEAVARFPFVRAMLARPASYYVTELALVQPLFVMLAVLAVVYRRRLVAPLVAAPVLWAGLGLATMTLLGARGMGFQMRYLCPMLPALYAGLYALLPDSEPARSRAATLGVMAALFAGATGIVNLVTLVSDDLVDLYTIGRRLAGS